MNASGASRRTASAGSGSTPPRAGSGLRTALMPLPKSVTAWAMASMPTLPPVAAADPVLGREGGAGVGPDAVGVVAEAEPGPAVLLGLDGEAVVVRAGREQVGQGGPVGLLVAPFGVERDLGSGPARVGRHTGPGRGQRRDRALHPCGRRRRRVRQRRLGDDRPEPHWYDPGGLAGVLPDTRIEIGRAGGAVEACAGRRIGQHRFRHHAQGGTGAGRGRERCARGRPARRCPTPSSPPGRGGSGR